MNDQHPGNQSSGSDSESQGTSSTDVSFEQASQEKQPGIVKEFLEFLVESKAWWLTPIIIVLLLVTILILMTSSVAAPFIYPIF